jgi:hypothetical protein
MFIVIDASACMTQKDLKPSRFTCVLKVYIKNYHELTTMKAFDQQVKSKFGYFFLLATRKVRVQLFRSESDQSARVDSDSKQGGRENLRSSWKPEEVRRQTTHYEG